MKYTRRGQSGGGAAVLVVLIAVLVILYILFLPPEERARLLGEPSGTPGQPGTPTVPGATVLYSSPVGQVVAPLKPVVSSDLAPVSLRAIEEAQIIVRRDTALAESNVFEKKTVRIPFTADSAQTRNAVLSLSLRSATQGNLIIYFNGVEVYNREASSRNVPPIELTNIQDYNEIEIVASKVGFAFWQTNRVTLSNILVSADVRDLSQAGGQQLFVLSEADLRDAEDIELAFYPVCAVRGPITITVNGAQLYTGTPDCNNRNTLEIAPARLNRGENTISWRTTEADMLIDLTRVTITGAPQSNKAFTFELDPAQVAGRPILMRISFSTPTEKQGYVTINGNRLPIQGGATYGLPITTALRPGPNAISFEAIGAPFEIVRFEVLRG